MRTAGIASLMALALVLTACASTADTTPTTAQPTTTSTASTTTSPTTTEPTTTTSTTTSSTTSTSSTTAPAPTTTTLPGEPIFSFPAAGDVLGVVGVRYDDMLNVRAAPGTDQPIVATLPPTFDDIRALGEARRLTQSIWYLVDIDGTEGWVSARFVAFLGNTDDITSSIVSELGEIPSAASMDALAEIVADTQVSTDPASVVTTTVAASTGDLGEITIDIIGLGDDSVFGLRLVIFGQSEDGGVTFGLKSVESTALCGRGVTEDLLCT